MTTHFLCLRTLEQTRRLFVLCLILSLGQTVNAYSAPLSTQLGANQKLQTMHPTKLSLLLEGGFTWADISESEKEEIETSSKPRLGVVAGYYYPVWLDGWMGPELGIKYGFTKQACVEFKKTLRKLTLREKALYVPIALRWGNKGLFAGDLGKSYALGYEFEILWDTERIPKPKPPTQQPPSLSGSFFFETALELPLGLTISSTVKLHKDVFHLKDWNMQGSQDKHYVALRLLRLMRSNFWEIGLGWNLAQWLIDQSPASLSQDALSR